MSDPEAVLSFLRQSHPDMICVTGDTFERHDFGDDPRKRMACSKWNQKVYDVAGVPIQQHFQDSGIRVK